jgi:CubicO group peptidase (beta-lactamase class C family)
MKLLTILLLAPALMSSLVFAQTRVPDKAIVSKADDYINALVRQERFSGAVLLARDGQVLLRKGYGLANREHGIANTPQTKFRLASLTKEFTATAIMMLQERGALGVHDSICKYVPECPATWQPVTLHHLMNHTSGIPEFYKSFPDIDSFRRKPTTLAEVVERARQLSVPAFKPGEKVSYSSLGFMLLGYVIEKASGESYEDFLRKNILAPLSMSNTGLEHQKVILKQRAAGYARDKDQSLINAPYYDLSYISAAGGLYSTVEDLYLWDQAFYTEKLLKKASLATMFTSGLENFAYAWDSLRQYNRPFIRADGRSFGFSNSLARYPDDKVTVIVLSNIETAGADKIADNLAAIIFGEKYEDPALNKRAKPSE